MGFDESLSILEEVKKEIGCSIITDIHEPAQAALVAEVVDVIQIPAFLCRQTDLLVSAAKTGKAVNVKKGQFLAPWDMKNVVAKLKESQCDNIILTDRGTQFGYNNLLQICVPFRLCRILDTQLFSNATHSAQLPGGNGLTSSGNRDMIPTLAKSAVAAGCDGLFMEVHDNVDSAKSDAKNSMAIIRVRVFIIRIKIYSRGY